MTAFCKSLSVSVSFVLSPYEPLVSDFRSWLVDGSGFPPPPFEDEMWHLRLGVCNHILSTLDD